MGFGRRTGRDRDHIGLCAKRLRDHGAGQRRRRDRRDGGRRIGSDNDLECINAPVSGAPDAAEMVAPAPAPISASKPERAAATRGEHAAGLRIRRLQAD